MLVILQVCYPVGLARREKIAGSMGKKNYNNAASGAIRVENQVYLGPSKTVMGKT